MYLDSFSLNRDLLTQRDSHECNSGQLWYVCVGNNFQGCCSVDACQLDNCPDDSMAAVGDATTTITKTTSSTITTSTTDSATQTSSQNTPSRTSSSTSTSNSSATISSQSTSQTTGASPSISQAATASQSSRPPADLASTASPVASSVSKSSNNVPIIVGSVAGGVALILLAIMGFFCFRRRQKKKQNRQLIQPPSPAFTFFNPAGKAIQTPSSINSGRRSVLEDVFAPFGGRYHTGTTNPSTPIPTITTTHASPNLQDPIQRTMSPDSGPLHDPDPEKSGLTPPPESSHPAFHPLPGVSSTRPAYIPNEGFTISELDGKPIDAMPPAVHQYQRVSELDSDDGRPSPMSTPGQSYAPGQGRESWRSPSPGASIPAWKKSIQEHRRWERSQNGGGSASSSHGNGETTPMLPISSSQTKRYPSQNQKPAPQFQYPNPHRYERPGSRNGNGKGKGKRSTETLARDASTHSIPVKLGLGSSHSRSHSASPVGLDRNHMGNAYDSSYSNSMPRHYQNQQQLPYPDYPEVVQTRNNDNQYMGESSQHEQYSHNGNSHAQHESVSSMGTSTAYGRTSDLGRG
ncbi:Adenovirus E3 region CR2 protein [Rutstroemia sp. NJR-2017a WRK4]|nr:Adenovirus E3 region CR2 protein [Rutstroemia sp. NJR-2017a WRK4]